MIFGISGCSASGKSFIVDYLKKNISSSKVSFIYQDNYYKKREDQSKDENGNYNFDLPTSFLNDELVRDLNLLKNGDQVVRKEYNFNNPNIDQKKVIDLFVKNGYSILINTRNKYELNKSDHGADLIFSKV